MNEPTPIQRDLAENNDSTARFYLIFDEIARLGVEPETQIEEVEEIELIALLSQDSSEEDQPRFITST